MKALHFILTLTFLSAPVLAREFPDSCERQVSRITQAKEIAEWQWHQFKRQPGYQLFQAGRWATQVLFPRERKSGESKTKHALKSLGHSVGKVLAYIPGAFGYRIHFPHEETRLKQISRLVHDLGVPVTQALLPGLMTWLPNPTKKIYASKKDAPVRDGFQKLSKYKQLDDYLRYLEFREKHPYLYHLYQMPIGAFTWGTRLAALLAAHHAAVQLMDENSTPSADEYLDNKELAPTDEEVQLLVESVPFPHLAIRIGDQVYSYGVTDMSVTPVAAYVKATHFQRFGRKLQKIYEEKGKFDPEMEERLKEIFSEEDIAAMKAMVDEKKAQKPDSLRGAAEKVAERVEGMDLLPRTIQVVTLKVGKKKRDELMRYFEMQRWKNYDNRTLVNDCATMVLRPMGYSNPLYDAAPSTIVTLASAMFSAEKAAGKTPRGKVFQVSADKPEYARQHILRNAYINYMEGALHLMMLPQNLQERLHMEWTFEPEDFQDWHPQIKKQIADFRHEVQRDIEEDKKFHLFSMYADKYAAEDAPEKKRQNLRNLINQHIDEKLKSAQEVMDSPESETPAIFRAGYELEILPVERETLLKKIE